MRKRYWIIGAVLLYAVVRQAGDTSTGEVESAKIPLGSEQALSVNTETSKPVPATTLSDANPADTRDFELDEQTESYPVRFVTGNRVAFRKGPSTSEGIIDRLESGRQVLLIKQSGEWSHVKDQLTQRDGWMASRFLGESQASREETQEREKSVPIIPDSTIIQRIIAESLASYPSSCACPYNTDRGGRRCGKRSAYSKPGGYSPICYAEDVTQAMIDDFRRR